MSLLYRDAGLVKMMHLGGGQWHDSILVKKSQKLLNSHSTVNRKGEGTSCVRSSIRIRVLGMAGQHWPHYWWFLDVLGYLCWKASDEYTGLGFLMLTLFTSVREIEGSKACKWATILEELKIRSTCVASLYKLNIFLKVLIQSKQGFDSKLNKLHFYWY